jgi:adenylate cyclase
VINVGLENQDDSQLLATTRNLLVETQALSTRLATINEIATVINRTLDLNEILRVVGKQARWLLDFKHCSVCVRNPPNENGNSGWRIITLFGKPQYNTSDFLLPPNSAITRVLQNGQALLLHEAATDDFLADFASQLCLPLESDRQILGAICFASPQPKRYNVEDMRIGHLLALQLSAALRNVEQFSALNRLNAQLEAERRKSESLLLNVLPANVADELKKDGRVAPTHYDSATVMFIDFEGFTEIAASLSPQELVSELDFCFSYFDAVIERYNLEKLKTIGDSYMCVGGVPVSDADHALNAIRAALEIQQFMRQLPTLKEPPYWKIRIGIHSGALIAGVVGYKKFAYDVWGDTVNIAARLESSGQVNCINISRATYDLVKDHVECEYRGEIEAKGKGRLEMFFVRGLLKPIALEDENKAAHYTSRNTATIK